MDLPYKIQPNSWGFPCSLPTFPCMRRSPRISHPNCIQSTILNIYWNWGSELWISRIHSNRIRQPRTDFVGSFDSKWCIFPLIDFSPNSGQNISPQIGCHESEIYCYETGWISVTFWNILRSAHALKTGSQCNLRWIEHLIIIQDVCIQSRS